MSKLTIRRITLISFFNLMYIRCGYLRVNMALYSKRHLDRKFQSYAGISPKELACILRFQVFYKLGWQVNFNDLAQLYEYYYDQSHFIKEFKKFTGNSPMTYFRKNGHFAEVFYN
jgi:methylphosphotriester-DNA--protein-cysteine methyltransferase